MSFLARLFGGGKSKPAPKPIIFGPSVSEDPEPTPVKRARRGARLALFATQGGSFGVTGSTPTARRKLLGN